MELSVCLIVKDEARNLPGLLSCLPLSEIELIVVDTGSADQTVEMAQAAGAKVIHHAWRNDFSEARNASLNAATRGTVLWLDADDRVDSVFWKEIRPLLDSPSPAHRCVVRSPREDGSCETFLQVRLFPNHQGIAFEGRIHEQVGSSLARKGVSIRDSSAIITHLGYLHAADREMKSRRNATLLRQEYAAHPGEPAVALQFGNALCQIGDYAGSREVFWNFIGFRERDDKRPIPTDERERMFPALIAETFEKSGDVQDALAWHALSRHWAPDYLRSGYVLAKEALKRGEAAVAFGHLLSILETQPRIGLVACDNAGVRANALALLVSMSLSPHLLQIWQAMGRKPETLHRLVQDGIQELAKREHFPLDRSALIAHLYRNRGWPALLAVLERWRPASSQEWLLLEDAVEAVVLSAPIDVQESMARLLLEHPEWMQRSGVLSGLNAMLREFCSGDSETARVQGWNAFRSAMELHPDDATVLGQFALFADRHRCQAEALEVLSRIPHPSQWLVEVMQHLQGSKQTDSSRLVRPLA
jgi:hypothetical protein